MMRRLAGLPSQRRWLAPEALNLSPALVGLPLATPWRRAAAMLIDVAVIGLLSRVSGFWLLGGLAIVIIQLRSKRGATTGRRLIWGWIGAAFIALLAVQELRSQWTEWRDPKAAAAAASADAQAVAEDERTPAPAPAASAPRPSDAQRIAQLEAELAQARKAVSWRARLNRFIDDIGLGLGWGVVYFSLLPAWWGGQTVGKKLLRMRVVELTGQPMTVMRSLRRYGGYAAGMMTGGLGYAQMLWDPNRQAIQDRTAHTAVIDLRPTALRPPQEQPPEPPA